MAQSTAQHHLCHPNWDLPQHHTLRFSFARRADSPRKPSSIMCSLTSSCTHCSCNSVTDSSQKPPPSYTSLHPQASRCPSSWDALRLRRRWPPRLVFATPKDRVVLDLCHLAFPRQARGSLPLLRLDIWATESKTLSLSLIWPRPHQHFDAERQPPVPTDKNALQSDWFQTSSTHCGTFQFYRKRLPAPSWPTNLVSLMATNHIQLVPRKHVSPTRSVPLRRFVQALVVCYGCRLRLHVPLHQATDTRQVRLVQETSNTTFSSTNTLLDKTVRVWIVGSSCGVKDRVFFQPVVRCAHKLSFFITVEATNTTQHNCISTIATLIVSPRLFASALTEPKRVSLRSATNRYSDPLLANGNLPVRSA